MISQQIFVAMAIVGLFSPSGAVATDSSDSPVEKVIKMLETLQTETVVEGKAEAKTYDKFACFCKDMSEEKSEAVTEGSDRVAELEATIARLNSFRTEQEQTMAEANKALDDVAAMEKAGKDKRAKEHEQFKKEKADVEKLKEELKYAKMTLVAEGDAGRLNDFLQTGSTALLQIKSFMEQAETNSQGPMTKEEIVAMAIAPLEKSAEESWQKIHMREAKEKNELTMVMQEVTDLRKKNEDIVKHAQAKIAETSEELGTESRELTMTSATLADDQQFLKEATASCNNKAKGWDQRSKMRSEELTALTTALFILKGKVAEKVASGKTVRLLALKKDAKKVQQPFKDVEEHRKGSEDDTSFVQLTSRQMAQRVVHHWRTELPKLESLQSEEEKPPVEDAMAKMAAQMSTEIKEADTKRTAFRSAAPAYHAGDWHKLAVIKLLKARAKTLDSHTLMSLAAQVSGSPFDKITKLVQELIERLLQEAADEANHQGWCNKEVGEAKGQRNRKAKEVSTLNQELASSEETRDKLNEDLTTLRAEIADLEDALAKATKSRSDESAENAATISEAEEGAAAVGEALDVLSKFYKTAAKAELVEVVTVSSEVSAQMPDAGFDEAHKGSQSASTGILGTMEVIKSDFERTVKVTDKAEKDAAKEFLEFETESKSSLAVKKNTKSAKETQLTETNVALADDMQSFTSAQALLDKAVQELLDLEPACFPKAEPYEQRVAKREQEIASLKEALCTLDKQGPVQTEAGDCGSVAL
jgi:hypothetical protein